MDFSPGVPASVSGSPGENFFFSTYIHTFHYIIGNLNEAETVDQSMPGTPEHRGLPEAAFQNFITFQDSTDRPTDRGQTTQQTDKQTDRQTDRQTGKGMEDGETDRRTDRPTGNR